MHSNWFHGNFSVAEKFLIFHTVILHKEWASSTSISVNTSSLFSLGNLNTAWITFLLLSITYHIYYTTIDLKLNVLTRFTLWTFQEFPALQILREIRLQMNILKVLFWAKIDFTKNLSGRKITIFPHCVNHPKIINSFFIT